MARKRGENGAGEVPSDFRATLWAAADKLRGRMEPSEYKHIALGLVFLKYISDAFAAKRATLEAEPGADPDDRDEYAGENIFWVPEEARWDTLAARARDPAIGVALDDAMRAIERENPTLAGMLPQDYARPALDKERLGELLDLFNNLRVGTAAAKARDTLGQVYEYFLSRFAGVEGKRGGEFYTPPSVVRMMVEMLEPFEGRIYDPCCGSGGMFVSSERFVEEHGGRIGQLSIYGQEMNPTTARLARMNLAIRGIDGKIAFNPQGSFHKDEFADLRFDFILANPPFNDSDWGGTGLPATRAGPSASRTRETPILPGFSTSYTT